MRKNINTIILKKFLLNSIYLNYIRSKKSKKIYPRTKSVLLFSILEKKKENRLIPCQKILFPSNHTLWDFNEEYTNYDWEGKPRQGQECQVASAGPLCAIIPAPAPGVISMQEAATEKERQIRGGDTAEKPLRGPVDSCQIHLRSSW